MAVDLELSRGDFLVPVLIRAVRAVGVQCGLDLDRLGDASTAVEAVALTWAADGEGAGDGLLRVCIAADQGAMEVAFSFPDPADALRARQTRIIPGSGPSAALDALAAAVVLEPARAGASRLVMSFRP